MARGSKSAWPTRRIIRWITKNSPVRTGPMPRGPFGETRWAVLDRGHHASTDGSARRTVRCGSCHDLARKLRLL